VNDLKLYRIINRKSEETGIEVDTKVRDVSERIRLTRFYSPIYDLVVPFWQETKVQLSTAVHLLFWIRRYREQIESEMEYGNTFWVLPDEFNELQKRLPLQRVYIYMNDYMTVLNSLHIDTSFEWRQYIWEYLWERERTISYNTEPSRQTCLFAFDNLEDVYKYKRERDAEPTQKEETEICEVQINDVYSLKKYDARWLDNLPETATYEMYLIAVKNYWRGKETRQPMFEYILHGKYVLKPIG